MVYLTYSPISFNFMIRGRRILVLLLLNWAASILPMMSCNLPRVERFVHLIKDSMGSMKHHILQKESGATTRMWKHLLHDAIWAHLDFEWIRLTTSVRRLSISSPSENNKRLNHLIVFPANGIGKKKKSRVNAGSWERNGKTYQRE